MASRHIGRSLDCKPIINNLPVTHHVLDVNLFFYLIDSLKTIAKQHQQQL